MRNEVRTDQGLTNQDLKDGLIIFGGLALIIGTRGALRGGGEEVKRQYGEMRDSIPNNASTIERTRLVLSNINYRLVASRAGRGAIDEIRRVIKGPGEKPVSDKPTPIILKTQILSQAA